MIYDFKYYEAGVEYGVSGYQNYRWIPEISFPMAHSLALKNGLTPASNVLDYGCAKGFLLKAFHLLGYKNVFGMDISQYAIDYADPVVKPKLANISGRAVLRDVFGVPFDLAIFKDVMEHIPAADVPGLLQGIAECSARLFIAVPLGLDNSSDRFVIPAMHNDVTHITIKDRQFWESAVQDNGWEILESEYTYPGMKTNWSEKFPQGNLFITARSRPQAAR